MVAPSSEEYKALCCACLGLHWMLCLLKFYSNLENGYWYSYDFCSQCLFLHLLKAHVFKLFQEAFQKFIGQPVSVFCSSRTVWGHALLQHLLIFLHFCCYSRWILSFFWLVFKSLDIFHHIKIANMIYNATPYYICLDTLS
jgi:hypothetical protein